jgi:hypothetical protein
MGFQFLCEITLRTSRRPERLPDMVDIELGEVWEMYSRGGQRWDRVRVTTIDDGLVKLRYEGVLEFETVDLLDMVNSPDRFRRAGR